MEKREFVRKLMMSVDQANLGSFISPFEAFSSSKNEYKGMVTYDSFKIRRRRRLFEMGVISPVAEGHFRQKDDVLVIESRIKNFRGFFVPIIFLIMLFYVAFLVSFISSDVPVAIRWIFVPFIFIHAGLMLGIPYFIMRRAVSRMKYELERDLYYLTKQDAR